MANNFINKKADLTTTDLTTLYTVPTAKTKTPLNYAKDALKIATIPARFLLNIKSPKDPLENFADYNMSPTDEVSSAISDYKKQMPDLTPVRVNNKVKREGLGDLNDVIQKLNTTFQQELKEELEAFNFFLN